MMLLGEYAVLHGKHALVCAINKRITVTLAPRDDKKIRITSTLGNLETELSELKIIAPFQFLLATIKKFSARLTQGCDLTITSEFSEKVGLGSSAAITIATQKIFNEWLNLTPTTTQSLHEARAIIQEVQGLGSGADTAASFLGGFVSYKAFPFSAEKLSPHYFITAIYSGYKTPTTEAVKKVENYFQPNPETFENLCAAIDTCAINGTQAIRAENWAQLGAIMNTQQELMHSLGVSTPDLNEIITHLRTDKNILGAKISGSGLGDCIIGLGNADVIQFKDKKIKMLPLSISQEGVRCEKS
jgi:mevalonate kinase